MDYELFKSQQNQLTEKITEMIKLEVDTRLACDRENRMLNETSIKKLIEELNGFKEAVEKQNKRFARDMKEANAENSERANFLSRYIDDQVKKLDEQVDEQLRKIKLLCAKLTEQVKEHFQNEEISLTEMRTDLKKNVDELNNGMNNLKDYCEASLSDIATHMAMERVLDAVQSESIYTAVNQTRNDSLERLVALENSLNTLVNTQEEQRAECEKRNKETTETLKEDSERKIQAILERLKGENQNQWAQATKLVEKIMSPEGAKEALKVAPPTVMKMDEIRKALDQIGENEAEKVRPKIVTGPSNPPEEKKAPPEEKKVPLEEDKVENKDGKELMNDLISGAIDEQVSCL
eukprot:TRINITY_DN712_c0_g1_i1.p5 TRINITY_DN712_c0_g1~~TRINITY_DN712_c0_g1_i1.p5  ORF type:complete len:350 (-),score=74.39 TRINITY_DN712_c0_g1_i1:2511-3560(-)